MRLSSLARAARGLCLLLLLGWAPRLAAHELPAAPYPTTARAYLVEIDGAARWQRVPNRRLPPASLVKLMTALLVVERGKLEDAVQIDRTAAHARGLRIGLRPGERLRKRDLLAAMLIASADDACRALALDAAGSTARFVALMNRRAQQLGLHDTRYANACGSDAPRQYSSAHDLAVLAHALLRHPEITALASQAGARIATLGGRRYAFASRNAPIVNYRGALGLKTGDTARAGKCVLLYAERDGHRVLVALLHAAAWDDAAALADLAFDAAQRR